MQERVYALLVLEFLDCQPSVYSYPSMRGSLTILNWNFILTIWVSDDNTASLSPSVVVSTGVLILELSAAGRSPTLPMESLAFGWSHGFTV